MNAAGVKSEEVQNRSSTIATFSGHPAAENAIRDLQKHNFDVTKLSIIGRDYHTQENVLGFYKTGDRMKYWGKLGGFWGGLWGLLAGAAFLVIPGVGPVLIAGPLAAWVIGALEGAVVVGGLSALGAGLVSLGIPRDKALQYESSVAAGKFLLVSHGTDEDAKTAREILESTDAEEVATHILPPEQLTRTAA